MDDGFRRTVVEIRGELGSDYDRQPPGQARAKMHTTNYTNTFIAAAKDTQARQGTLPRDGARRSKSLRAFLMPEQGMTEKTEHGWTVLDDAKPVWCYQYGFATDASANCLATRMPDERLLVLSPALNLPEGAFEELAQLGDVGAVVANNGWHHLGIPDWRSRFPRARFFASPLAAKRIAKKNPAAGELEALTELRPLLGDDCLLHEVSSSKCGETWAVVKVESGYLWFVSDTLVNMPTLPKSFVPRLMFKWTGSAPGYRVFHLWLRFNVRNKTAVLDEMVNSLEEFPPSIVVPAHGKPIMGPDVATETTAVVRAALPSPG